MPTLQTNGARIHYVERGTGPETIVFAHGLLFSHRMYDAQLAAFEGHYRCIAFDFRGQGQSEVTASGYDMETLTADTVALVTELQAAPCHFVGLSMGGFVGLRLAAHRPELLRSLVLMETAAGPEPAGSALRYRLMNAVARVLGFGVVTAPVMRILFGRRFLEDPGRAAERDWWRDHLRTNDRTGVYRAVEGVCARAGVEQHLARIAVPTLIVVGDADVATPVGIAEQIAHGIPHAQLVVIPGAGHSAAIEEPRAVNAQIAAFLRAAGGERARDPEPERHDAGG